MFALTNPPALASSHGLSRRTDVLHQRNDGLLRQRALFDRLVCRVLFVVLRMNSANMKCPHLFIHLHIYTFVHLFCAMAMLSGKAALGVASALIFSAIAGSKPFLSPV